MGTTELRRHTLNLRVLAQIKRRSRTGRLSTHLSWFFDGGCNDLLPSCLPGHDGL